MPERVQVWLDDAGRPQFTVASHMNTAVAGMYVPESRLHEMEAERDMLMSVIDGHREDALSAHAMATMASQEATALRADLAALAEQMIDALTWCGGSADFGYGGQARKGWERGPMQAIAAARAVLDREGA